MVEFFESLFSSYKGRYKNKFIGAFFLFYLALNWKKVAVIFFISDMTYRDFVFHWSDDASSILFVICWAFILTCLYLAVSPWLSFSVHVAQSKAIAEYKIQTLKNESLIFQEKQKMELVRSEALILEQKNVESEAAIKKAVNESNVADDESRYAELVSKFSEEKIRNVFSQMESGDISFSAYNSIFEFCDKIQSIEYHFDNESLDLSRLNYAESMMKLSNFMKNNTQRYSGGYSMMSGAIALLPGLKNHVVDSYRDFFRVGRSSFQ